MDSFSIWGLCTVAVFLLSLIVGSFILALIWLIASAEIGVVLWTPLRSWLEIPERQASEPRSRAELMDQSLGMELIDQGVEP